MLRVLCLAAFLPAALAHATLEDEIQVYDDSINAPGEFGLELHVNATPSGPREPEEENQIHDVHGVRTTFEGSYSVSKTVELGIYVPFDHTAAGDERFAGPRVRLKYIPKRGTPDSPWFYGINFELSHVKAEFEETQDFLEVRPIMGWRAEGWLIAFNPVFGQALRPGERQGGPDFSPSVKVAKEWLPGISPGFEYYADMGKFGDLGRYSSQSHTLFAAIDVDRAPFVFNFGIGRGLTSEADRWTVKAIFELPI